MRITNKQTGSTLLMALLVTAAVLAVAVGLSVLIIREVRSTGRIGQSIVAFHSAESGIEEGLYVIKKTRLSGETLDFVLGTLVDDAEPWEEYQHLYDSNSMWKRTAEAEVESITIDTILQDESRFIQIFNNDDLNQSPRYLDITWDNNGAILELTWIGWDPTKGFADQAKTLLLSSSQQNISLEYTFPDIPVIDGEVLPWFKYYELQLRAIDQPMNNIEIKAYWDHNCPDSDGDGFTDCQILLPSTIEMTSIGSHPAGTSLEKSRQALKASVLWSPPLSGLYSFVLFSECTITKSDTVECL